MQGPAAGAENLLLDDQAAVVMTVEEEVVRRSQGLTAGCCRCSWSKAVLATLLALAVGAAAALGYLQLTQETSHDAASNSHKCYTLQGKSNVKHYEVFTADKHAYYYIYSWVAFSIDHSATAVLQVTSNNDNREISTRATFKHLAILNANVTLFSGHKVSLDVQSEFTAAEVCRHELPAKSK